MFEKRDHLKKEIRDIKDRRLKVYNLIVKEREEKGTSKELDKVYVELGKKLELKEEEYHKVNKSLGFKIDPIVDLRNTLATADTQNQVLELMNVTLKKLEDITRDLAQIMALEPTTKPILHQVVSGVESEKSVINNQIINRRRIDKEQVKQQLEREIEKRNIDRIEREKEEKRLKELMG